jgi:hypothetical protein
MPIRRHGHRRLRQLLGPRSTDISERGALRQKQTWPRRGVALNEQLQNLDHNFARSRQVVTQERQLFVLRTFHLDLIRELRKRLPIGKIQKELVELTVC